MLHVPPKGSTLDADAVRHSCEIARDWYLKQHVSATVRSVAHEVRKWLSSNKSSTDKRGDQKSGEPWFSRVSFTDDPDRLDIRTAQFRMRLYGHGTRYMLNRMVERELLGEGALNFFREATGFECMAIHEQLVANLLAGVHAPLTQEDVKNRFDFSEGTNATKVRPRLVRMATFGLWHVRADARFSITLGPVAEIFHREVFSPVRSEFISRIQGVK